MDKQRIELWPPRQGSWEEAVDPYEVQFSRLLGGRMEPRLKREKGVEEIIERQAKYNIPASA